MKHNTPVQELSATAVCSLLNAPDELAFLDVREEGVFSEGHAFYAVSAPLSHLEVRLPRLVPRKGARVVLMDGGDDALAAAASERMRAWGYTDVHVLCGGLSSWRAAQYPIFSGVYVPSKAFGEFVEQQYYTPSIDADTLQSWMDGGKDMVILDSRPYAEFHRFSLPGGINCPGADLVYRVFDAVASENTTIVVNCAGRTRGIIGAQSLINATISNPVVTLKNGTQGWVLSGRQVERGSTRVAAPPTVQGLARAREAAAHVARRFGVTEMDATQLSALRQENARTLYLFDVRTPSEYAAGHLPEFLNAPGGQLVQSTDHYVGTRNARIVLCDDTGVRARMTASWLLQLGWPQVYVLKGGLAQGGCLVEGGEAVETLPPLDPVQIETITVVQLAQALAQDGVDVLDLASSRDYRRGHIPGAWFVVRSRIADILKRMPSAKPLVLTSGDGEFARLAAAEVVKAGRPARCLQGGTAAWQAAGQPLTAGEERMACLADDVWYSPHDTQKDQHAAMQAYLRWEIALMDQLEREGGVPFKVFR